MSDDSPTVTARRSGPWTWQNWRWPDGEGFYATETPREDGGWYHWTLVRDGRGWLLTCDDEDLTFVECRSMRHASEIVEVANDGPQ